MARAMRITAEELMALKVVDRVVAEPLGGAHVDPDAAVRAVGDALESELEVLYSLSPEALRRQRSERFYAIGRSFA